MPTQPENTRKGPRRRSRIATPRSERTDVPLLRLYEPDPKEWDDSWGSKLRWIKIYYGISIDVMVKAGLGSRSTMNAYISGERGEHIAQSKLVEMSDKLGFPMYLWNHTLPEFDAWLREEYPGYSGPSAAARAAQLNDNYEPGGLDSSWSVSADSAWSWGLMAA